jgi:hypothetical protein
MHGGGYVQVSYPWRAAVGIGSPHPARFYTALVGQTLNYRMPASRRFGSLLAIAGRRGLPERPLAHVLRRLPGRARADLDELGEGLERAWPQLAAASSSLPAEAPELTLLALQRSAALTVFAFGDASDPLFVAKLPKGDGAAADAEVAALAEALPTGLAPRSLGTVDGARVQEAIPGAPMRVAALTPARARVLDWPDSLRQVTEGLGTLAAATVKRERPAETVARSIELALADGRLSARAQTLLRAAGGEVDRLDRAVLQHGDSAAQNCLFADGRLSGLVDWENAKSHGMPAFDVLNAPLAYLEFGVGLVRWSQELITETFEAAWRGSEFGIRVRASAAQALAAADLGEALLEPLEVAFFGTRLGRRLARPADYPTTVATASRQLELVCAG